MDELKWIGAQKSQIKAYIQSCIKVMGQDLERIDVEYLAVQSTRAATILAILEDMKTMWMMLTISKPPPKGARK